MWKTRRGGDGKLLPTPEFRTAHIDGQQVRAGESNEGSGSLVRYVALVKVVIHETSGLNLVSELFTASNKSWRVEVVGTVTNLYTRKKRERSGPH
jgi:hypothetical protein